jgi:hypothetical protein
MNENSPIFVRGLSRSGGTLMVTILDAHPDIAMSYELYPNLLIPLIQGKLSTGHFFEILSKSRKGKKLEKKPENRGVRIFVNRCPRGGLDRGDLVSLFQEHLASGDGFRDITSCLRFIERCSVKKMKTDGKSQWGLKCNSNYREYLKIWPRARFLNMVRDGRDVLASQLNTGSFNNTPSDVGRGWTNVHKKFRALVDDPDVRAYEVFYERLVREPEEEVRRICDFLGVPFDEAMLSYYRKDLTIYTASHLSMGRISKPVDTSKIGRWKKELTEEQLNEFYSLARETMIRFGYLGGE